MKYSLILALAFILAACAHDSCSNLPQRPQGAATDDAAAAKAAFVAPVPSPAPADPNLIQVFKPTGEKQCGQGPATPIATIQNELTKRQVSVSESHTQPDGMMHMALCGAPTGMIYLFTIQKKDLVKAVKAGFKLYVSQQ